MSESIASWHTRWARALYRLIAPIYDLIRVLWSSRRAESDLDALFGERIDRDSRILELAPGTGVNISRLLRCSVGFDAYVGIDISQAMLDRARSRTAGDPRIVLRLGDVTRISDELGSFDFAVSTWLLSHLEAPAALVRATLDRLAPNGTAAFLFFSRPTRGLGKWLAPLFLASFRGHFVDVDELTALDDFEQARDYGYCTLVLFRRGSDAA